jgi:hypothetical protein
MNTNWSEFEQLADLASREPVPPIDVAARVAESLQPGAQPRPSSAFDWPLLAASALSVAAAVLVMTLASYQGALTADPLAEFFQPVIPVIQ